MRAKVKSTKNCNIINSFVFISVIRRFFNFAELFDKILIMDEINNMSEDIQEGQQTPMEEQQAPMEEQPVEAEEPQQAESFCGCRKQTEEEAKTEPQPEERMVLRGTEGLVKRYGKRTSSTMFPSMWNKVKSSDCLDLTVRERPLPSIRPRVSCFECRSYLS